MLPAGVSGDVCDDKQGIAPIAAAAGELAGVNADAASDLWLSLLPLAWQALSDRQRHLFTGMLGALSVKDYHQYQRVSPPLDASAFAAGLP